MEELEHLMKYNALLQPGRIGELQVKNRAVLVPVATHFGGYDGCATMRLIRYYEERAKGGVGLIINEYTCVDEVYSLAGIQQYRMSQDHHIAGAEQLTEAVHRHGAYIFAQLHHAGSTSKQVLTHRQPISPSDIPPVPGGPVPKAMTEEEIKHTIQKFVDAAVRCQKAGYDGVELHGAHSYLIAQFFSAYYNKRTDQYGGSFENRMRFVDEIIDGIHAALGPRFPIIVRMSGDEMANVPDTLTLEEGLRIAEHLEAKGIVAIDISNGGAMNANANCDPYFYTPGWKKHVAAAYKQRLNIPVIATNTIKTPDFAESLLEEDVCDFVGLGRSLLADPHFVAKAASGRADEVRNCIGCMVCRERLLGKELTLACAVNARTGREYIFGEEKRNGNGRPAVVAGGGPAGMEAARVLAERGFKVTLFEKSDRLGGTLNLADKPKSKELITALVQSMQAQLTRLGVDIRTGTEATPERVRELNPAGLIFATGARPVIPKIPGVDGQNVCTAEAVITGDAKPSGKIVVVGSGLTGFEAAEMLAQQGCSITMAEMLDTVGPGLYAVIRNGVLESLKPYNPTYLTGHRLVGIEPGRALLEKEGGEAVAVEADAVVLALGVSPASINYDAYGMQFNKVAAVGDAVKGGRIYDAIKNGFERAYTLDI